MRAARARHHYAAYIVLRRRQISTEIGEIFGDFDYNSGMDIKGVLAELREERSQVDEAISALQQIAASRKKLGPNPAGRTASRTGTPNRRRVQLARRPK